jgi:hypothetical protein
LIRSTKDATKAQELQSLALDIAAGTGKDLSAVSEALGKAYDGNLGALKRLGVGIDDSIIKSKDFDAAAAALSATFEGQASKQAETFAGKMARLNVAFDEAKETVGSYVLDALTPLIGNFVDKGIPAIQDFASNLSKTLGPAFMAIFKVIRDDLLPILTTWWRFLYEEIIPAIGSVVGPILAGLKSAFDSIKKAITDNSAELQPFYDALEKVWDFIKKYLAPLLGGTFKLALEVIGEIVGGLVTGFSKLVGFINSTIIAITKFVNFVKDNPVTRFFFGGDDGRPLVGRIQHVLAELLAHLGLALLNGSKAFLGSPHQLSARQHKVAHGQSVGVFLFGVQARRIDGFVLCIQTLVCTEARVKLSHAWQCFGVCSAQLWRVGHRVQMAHSAPSTAEFFGGHIQHGGNGFPLGREVGGRDLL